ncbi:hypothetical protein RND71_002626 [Anisodus tanguticus]|uniref:DUF4283 domain-containing protein n=1 Tax=Anisodus tanguticus TaxID=243964 RepID=A0AAE1T2X6_9SOLA|nr:hypothetical protein RND71_002626 [Anisodus tanguticus]
MAIATPGRPPPEGVQPPTVSPTISTPLDYSKLFRPSSLNHHVFAAGGQNPTSGGGNTTSSQVPFKPVTYLRGEPTIRFNKEEIEVMIHQQDLRFAVVVKFSYGWPEISYLRTSIPKQYELKREVRIGLLCNRHVLIRCSLFEDYLILMSKPNWNIMEKGVFFSMRTFKWNTWFDSEEETSLVVTWISLPGLPPTYYGEAQLFSIAAAALHPELFPEKEQGIDGGNEKAAKPARRGDLQQRQLVTFLEEGMNAEPLASEDVLTIEATRKKKSGKTSTAVVRQMPMREAKKDKAARKKCMEWSLANERASSTSHGWPDIAFLRTAIPKQCGLKAEVRIGLLCDRHGLIRCTIVEDFDTLMSRQTFEIKEKNKPYLMRTFKWDVTFNPSEES